MANVTGRRTGELLRQLFDILIKNPDGMQAKDALAALVESVTLTEYEKGYYGQVRRFEKIVRFATVDTVKAGWLTKSKGRWTVTEEGKRAHARLADPEQFYQEASKLYRQWKASQPPTDGDEDDSKEGPTAEGDRDVTLTFEAAEEQAWIEIEQYLRQMPPYDFQELVASLLRAMGYHVSWVAPPGKDGGLDILAYSDPLGTRPPRIKVQVKRRADNITVEGLRSFMALLGDDDVGLFVTTGGFTKDAHDEARTQEKRKVTLVDLERLFDLWVEHYRKLDDEARRRLPLRPIWFLAPIDQQELERQRWLAQHCLGWHDYCYDGQHRGTPGHVLPRMLTKKADMMGQTFAQVSTPWGLDPDHWPEAFRIASSGTRSASTALGSFGLSDGSQYVQFNEPADNVSFQFGIANSGCYSFHAVVLSQAPSGDSMYLKVGSNGTSRVWDVEDNLSGWWWWSHFRTTTGALATVFLNKGSATYWPIKLSHREPLNIEALLIRKEFSTTNAADCTYGGP